MKEISITRNIVINSDRFTVQVESRMIFNILKGFRSSPMLNLPRIVNLKHSFLRLWNKYRIISVTIDEYTSYISEGIIEI